MSYSSWRESIKRKPKKKLTPLQESRYVRVTVLLLIAAVAWIFFAPRSGVWAVWQQHSRLKELERKTSKIEQGNRDLEKEIKRLRNDPAYLEEVARREHGMLKKNEYIFDFSQQKKEK